MTDEENDLKQMILGQIEDSVSDLLYYNRQEDEDLPVGEIENAIHRLGIITVEEMVNAFETALKKNM